MLCCRNCTKRSVRFFLGEGGGVNFVVHFVKVHVLLYATRFDAILSENWGNLSISRNHSEISLRLQTYCLLEISHLRVEGKCVFEVLVPE